jgi:uncharacterized membrane protein
MYVFIRRSLWKNRLTSIVLLIFFYGGLSVKAIDAAIIIMIILEYKRLKIERKK